MSETNGIVTLDDDEETTAPPVQDTEAPRFRKRVSTRKSDSAHRNSSINFLDIQESSHFLVDERPNADGRSSFPWIKTVVTSLGLILGLVLCFITIEDDRRINQTLGIAIWMATLWITEIIPLVVTSFLPLVLFPLFGIVTSSVIATQYVNNTIWLLVSGFMVALTLERWNLHRRFSLKVLTWCGTRPQFLLMGMMGATFFLSMFISNTATTLMMVPNAISVCKTLEDSASASYRAKSKRFAIALMLGIAYAANMGGMSSLIGTAPNLVFQRQLELLFPDAPEFTFADWISFGLPTGLVMVVFIWIYLCFTHLRAFTKEDSSVDPDLFHRKYAGLGRWTQEQIVTAVSFAAICLLWLFRADLNFGNWVIPGWSNLFPEPSFVSDGTTGMAIAFLMFVCPARSANLAPLTGDDDDGGVEEARILGEKDRGIEEPLPAQDHHHTITEPDRAPKYDTTILDWDTANKMPYDVVFLLGGGFALARAFVDSGLSKFLGERLATLEISLPALIFLMITLIIWLTELTSNTATSNIMVPIAASIAVAIGASPYSFMIPGTMACSCAFVLPIATPPNMVVFSTGRLPMREMNRAGVLLNVFGSLLLLGAAFSIIPAVLGVRADEFPLWAEDNTLLSTLDQP